MPAALALNGKHYLHAIAQIRGLPAPKGNHQIANKRWEFPLTSPASEIMFRALLELLNLKSEVEILWL
jgi:hypothetical protein